MIGYIILNLREQGFWKLNSELLDVVELVGSFWSHPAITKRSDLYRPLRFNIECAATDRGDNNQ